MLSSRCLPRCSQQRKGGCEAVRASVEWARTHREANREKEKEKKKRRGKEFKTKSQSGVQWHDAQREVTSMVVRGDCSRNPSDGRDHACLHARDNDAARRRLFFVFPLFLALLSRPSLFFSFSFLYFSRRLLFSVFFSFFFPFSFFSFSSFHPRLHR